MKKFSAKSLFFAGIVATFGTPSVAQAADKLEGTLNIVWGDSRADAAGGETRFSLSLADGKTYALSIRPALQGTMTGYFGRRVAIEGQLGTTVRGIPEILVQKVVPLGIRQVARTPVTKRVLFILLKYQGETQEPHTPNFYLALTNPKKPNADLKIPATINAFFDKTSWGNLQWKADATKWLQLPHPKTYYANCGFDQACADLDSLSNDAFALTAKAGIEISKYDNINFVLNNDLDCCAWGGGTSYQGKSFGATWEPPWGQETSVYSHEFGHSIGLPHSGWVYYAYDSPWDIMSMRTAAQRVVCASYYSDNDGKTNDVNCTEPGDGYIAPHKDYLGWMPAKNMVVLDKPAKKTVTLEANALPLGSATKMVKICYDGEACSGSSAHYLTVEARVGVKKFEKALTGDGVIIQDVKLNRGPIGGKCYFNSQSGFAVPIDATPGDWDSDNCNSGGRTWPNYALGNAEFLPGQSYKDTAHHITVDVKSKAGSSYVVEVTRHK